MPEYQPRYWDYDDAGQLKRRTKSAGNPGGINCVSIRRFERLFTEAGFRIARRKPIAFNGLGPIRLLSRGLSVVPFVNEYFTACMIYELERLADT